MNYKRIEQIDPNTDLPAYPLTIENEILVDIDMGSKKTLKDKLSIIGEQIDELIFKQAKLTLKATPSLIFNGGGGRINVEANLTVIKDNDIKSLDLLLNDTIFSTVKNQSYLSHIVELTPEQTKKENCKISAIATCKSNKKLETYVTIAFVFPMYIGSGKDYNSILSEPSYRLSERKTPFGTYQLNIKEVDNIWIVAPSTMNMTSDNIVLSESGFGIPFEQPINIQLNGTVYNVFKSFNKYKNTTINITIK